MRQVSNQRHFGWPITENSPSLIAWEPMSGADLTRWTRKTKTGSPTSTVNADGTVTVTASSSQSTTTFVSGIRPRALAFAAEVTIKAGFATSDVYTIAPGLFHASSSVGVWSYYNGTGCGVFDDGAATTTGASPTQPTAYTPDTTQDLTIGIYMMEPQASVYVRQGDHTAFVSRSNFTLDGTTAANNRVASTWRDWRLGFEIGPTANKSLTVTKFAAAYMPAVGVTNPRIVTYKDGTPYTRWGHYFFTQTIYGASGDFDACGTGLFAFNQNTYRATLIGHVFFDLSGVGITHSVPLHLIYDDTTDEWICLGGTWAPGLVSTGVDLTYGTTTKDITAGGTFVIPVDAITVSGASASSCSLYDGTARWDSANSKWRVGCVITAVRSGWSGSQHYPAYLEGTSLTSLSLVRQDTSHGAMDGAQWAKVGGNWYLIYGGSASFVAYDENLQNYTALTSWSSNVPSSVFNSFGSYPPHAALLPVADEATTRYVALCYGADVNPLNNRGSLVVLEADEQPTGFEFTEQVAPPLP